MMNSKARWVKGFESTVDNGRGHETKVDLPESQNGEDVGATALELAVMGLSGCITTIFAVVAKKMRLDFEELIADVGARKGDVTIESAHILITVKTDDIEKTKKVLDQTLKMCPIGILYEQAGVEITHELMIKQ